jgi:hypothetical protein
VTAFACSAERLTIARVKLDAVAAKIADELDHLYAISVQIADHVEVTILTCAADRLVIARIQVDTILMKVAEDVEVPPLACLTERLIVVRLQVSALSVKPANGIKVTPPRGITNRPVQVVGGPVRGAYRVNDPQQSNLSKLVHPRVLPGARPTKHKHSPIALASACPNTTPISMAQERLQVVARDDYWQLSQSH